MAQGHDESGESGSRPAPLDAAALAVSPEPGRAESERNAQLAVPAGAAALAALLAYRPEDAPADASHGAAAGAPVSLPDDGVGPRAPAPPALDELPSPQAAAAAARSPVPGPAEDETVAAARLAPRPAAVEDAAPAIVAQSHAPPAATGLRPARADAPALDPVAPAPVGAVRPSVDPRIEDARRDDDPVSMVADAREEPARPTPEPPEDRPFDPPRPPEPPVEPPVQPPIKPPPEPPTEPPVPPSEPPAPPVEPPVQPPVDPPVEPPAPPVEPPEPPAPPVEPPSRLTLTSDGSALVGENGTAAYRITAEVEAPRGPLAYAIGGADAALFAVDATGRVSFKAAPDFERPSDRDGDGVYDLVVEVSDGTTTASRAVSIAVADRDEAPTAIGLASDGLAIGRDGAAGALVGRVAGLDPDRGDRLVYSLADDAGGRFAIDADTGEIRVAAGASFDDSVGRRGIVVEARDGGGLSVRQAFDVAIESGPPVTAPGDADAAPDRVAENAAVGTRVGVAVAAVDPGSSVAYALVAPTGEFAIDARTGVVTVAGPIDFEAGPSRTLVVRATSGDGSTAEASFTIAVENRLEVAGIRLDGASVDEDAAAGTLVGVAEALGRDPGDVLAFSLLDDAGGLFAIDAATGAVTIADPARLDHEAAARHDLTVRVTDAGGLSLDRTLTVAVDDRNEAPRLLDAAGSGFLIVEGAAVGTAVGSVAILDPDLDDTVTFSLADDAGGRFAIDAASGVVSVRDGAALDFETAAGHTIRVRATDAGGNADERDYAIAVTDANEHAVTAPVDRDAAANAVSEQAAIGTRVGITAGAEDADGTTNAVRYSLVDGTGEFAVDAVTGVVTVAGALDLGLGLGRDLVVRATSADGSHADRTVSLTVDQAPTAAVLGEAALGRDLVAAFDFDGASPFSSLAGLAPTLAPSDPAGLGASLHGTGAALDLAGGTYATVQGVPIAGPVTISLWARFDTNSSWSRLFDAGVRGHDEFLLTREGASDTIALHLYRDGAYHGVRVPGAIVNGEWAHWTASIDEAGRLSLYRNGDLLTQGNGALPNITGGQFFLGRSHWADDPLDGAIDDLAIHGRALTDAEVRSLFEASLPGLGRAEVAAGSPAGTLVGTVTGFDPTPGDVLAYALADDAGGRFVIDAATGAIRIAPGAVLEAGPLDVTVRVADAAGGSRLTQLRIDVAPAQGREIVGTDGANLLVGTPGHDVIRGLDGDDRLIGGDGNDRLEGGGGANRLLGGDGDDTIIGGPAVDHIDGGAGADFIDGGGWHGHVLYETSDAGVQVDLAAGTASGGHAEGDVIVNVQHLNGSVFADRLVGTDAGNYLDGREGDDVILAGGGNDRSVFGGDGNDVIDGGDGDDRIEGNGGDDILVGGEGADELLGGDGNDVVRPGGWIDVSWGGAGIDELDFAGAGFAVTVDLATGAAIKTDAGGSYRGERAYEFENATGSNASNAIAAGDRLLGTGGANVLKGLGGDDVLHGRAGDDVLEGGDGADDLDGGAGDDALRGGAGDDRLAGGGGRDLVEGGAGRDTAVFAGDRSAYVVTVSGETTTVASIADPGDRAVVTGVELFAFRDGLLAAGEVTGGLLTQRQAGLSINTDGGNATYLRTTAGGDIIGGLGALTLEMTLSSLVPAAAGYANSPTLFSYVAPSNGDEIWIGYYRGDDAGVIGIQIGTGYVEVPLVHFPDLADATPHRFAFAWDGATGGWAVDIDGARLTGGGLSQGHRLAAGGTIFVGQDGDAGKNTFQVSPAGALQGDIHDVRLFSTARTAADMQADAGRDLEPSTPGLVAGWRFDGLVDGRVTDHVAGRDLVLQAGGGSGWQASTPRPVLEGGALRVDENAPDGAWIGRVGYAGGDPAETFSFAIVDATGAPVVDPRFELVAAGTGADLRVRAGAAAIDAEAQASHALRIRVVGNQGADETRTLEVGVNDIARETLGPAGGISPGTAGNDVLAGAGGPDTLLGLAGDDRLEGGGGDDRLFGDDGSDTLLGGAGNDELSGDAGNDAIDGGAGRDAALYTGGRDDYDPSLDGAGRLVVADRRGGAPDGTDTLSDAEEIRFGDLRLDVVLGTAGSDALAGSARSELLVGGDGADALSYASGGGDDVFAAGAGTDAVHLAGFEAGSGHPGWTLVLDAGATQTLGAGDEILLSDSASGRIDIEAGGSIRFTGLERITW